jgi:hypothetical protein
MEYLARGNNRGRPGLSEDLLSQNRRSFLNCERPFWVDSGLSPEIIERLLWVMVLYVQNIESVQLLTELQEVNVELHLKLTQDLY